MDSTKSLSKIKKGDLIWWHSPKLGGGEKIHLHLCLDSHDGGCLLLPLSSKSISYYWKTSLSSLPIKWTGLPSYYHPSSSDGYPCSDKLCWWSYKKHPSLLSIPDSSKCKISKKDWDLCLDSLEYDLYELDIPESKSWLIGKIIGIYEEWCKKYS